MRKRSRLISMIVWVGCLAFTPALRAQDEESPKPLQVGAFQTQGSVTTGYRFTDVKGYRPMFLELYNLQKGFRLMDFSLYGKAQKGSHPFADDFSLTTSGLGGDPFPSAQLTLRKNNLYDLRVSYRQSYYYWNLNDNAGLPSGFSGLTSYHDWQTVRKMGSLNFLLHATNRLRFSFDYYRSSRDGINFTTRSLDYFGSAGLWGFFARANPYYVEAPLHENANRVAGGVDYSMEHWNFHYRLGYQTFEDLVRGNNISSPQRSINVNDRATAKELVNSISWSEFRQLKTPISEFSYNGKLTSKLETRGGYIFYRYRGPATLDMAFDGTARTNIPGTTFAPYAISLDTRAHVTEPNHIIDQGFTYRVKPWWNIVLDYRYSRFTIDSPAAFRSLKNGSTVTTGETLTQWRTGTHTADFSMEFFPTTSLVVKTGVRLFKSDIEGLEDGVTDPVHTKRIKTVWPTASVYWQPSKMLSLRADVDEVNNGASYTRMMPRTNVGGRVTVRFHPLAKFYIDNSLNVRTAKLLIADFRNTFRSNSILATYQYNDHFSIFGGISYDSIFARGFIDFIRGTPPLTGVLWRDQEINRVWQAGFEAKPLRRLGFSFTGNFVRSTGRGAIAGEPPLYGPMSYPYATGTLYYDFPTIGRLSVDLQRTYYIEQIVTGNNFSANMLTVRWTRNF